MKNMNYFLCSQEVINTIKPKDASRPFKSGYDFDFGYSYFVALLCYEDCKKAYEKLSPKKKEDFWIKELVPSTIDVSKVTLFGLKKNGVFKEIEIKTGLTQSYNTAMAIHDIAKRSNLNPIELINKVTPKKK